MIKLGRGEKKLINVALVVIASVVFFLAAIYFPKSKALEKVKAKVEKNDALVADIRKMIGVTTDLNQGLGILRKASKTLSEKYIDQTDLFLALNRISEAADSARVRVISITPQNLSSYNPQEGGSLKYYEKSCLKQPVKVIIEGRYEQLVQYLNLLENSPVGIFTVDGFGISKEKAIIPDLRMEVTIGLYIFGEDTNSARKI